MDLEIAGNAALVTASSSGLGKASATALAREGVDVALNGRDEGRLNDAVADVREFASGEVIGLSGDITDANDVTALVDGTVEEFGRLDHLVTSTGGPPAFAPLEGEDEDWYEAFDLLVMSVVRAVREAAPHLREDGGGTIVNITSKGVKEATTANVLTSSVRMSVVGLEKTLSRELAPEVRSNAVLPASVDTQRVRNLLADAVERGEYESEEAAVEARTQATPLRRLADPMELGDTVAYLSSPRSGFINGDAILIDGGSASGTL